MRRPVLRVSLVALAAMASTVALPARAVDAPKLLVWINGDKGYNGLQKVGDAFTAVSGVPVVVQHPEGATDKFQAAAAAGRTFSAGHTTAPASGRARA